MINDFKPIANDVAANVETQLQYETDLGPGGVLQHGYQSGTAPSQKVNKTVRQSSMIAAAMAQAISDILQVDMLDDGDLPTLVTRLKSAILNGAWTTGDVKLTLKIVPDTGWLVCDDGTIGSTASTATHNSDLNKALFIFIWTNVIDTWAPVVGGRGGSALGDWNLNKKITMTRMLGRALAIAGSGSGLTARALGEFLGQEDAVVVSHAHPLHDPGHFHGISVNQSIQQASSSQSTPTAANGGSNTSTDGTGITIDAVGVSGVGKNMQPSGFLNAHIKQ